MRRMTLTRELWRLLCAAGDVVGAAERIPLCETPEADEWLERWVPYEEHVRELGALKLLGEAYTPEDYRVALEKYLRVRIEVKTVPEVIRGTGWVKPNTTWKAVRSSSSYRLASPGGCVSSSSFTSSPTWRPPTRSWSVRPKRGDGPGLGAGLAAARPQGADHCQQRAPGSPRDLP